MTKSTQPAARYLWFSLLTISTACVVLSGAGCGSKRPNLPATYLVRGTVVDSAGQPLTGGAIYFKSSEKDRLEATGDIGSDGKFELRTVALGERLSGAIAGKHTVVVVPAGKPGDIPPAMELPEVVVEPKDNEFTIKLPAKPK